MRRCKFCDIASGLEAVSEDQIVADLGDFVVIRSVSSFLDSWFLLISKSHELSFLDFSSEVISKVISKLVLLFPDHIVFEHGAKTEGDTVGCSIDHAHLHLVKDSRLSEEQVLCVFEKAYAGVSALKLSSVTEVNSSYLALYQLKSDTINIVEKDQFPSQEFRRILAELVELEGSWDWRAHSSSNLYSALLNIKSNAEA